MAGLVLGVGFFLALFASRNNTIPNNDEIYHLAAAESLVESGELAVGEGFYRRGATFTRYVAMHFRLFGSSVETGKAAVAAIFGLFLAAIFLVLRQRLSTAVALLTTVLFALSPLALEYAPTVRFYMPQALFFWIGAWCIYRAVAEVRQPIISLVAGAMAWAIALAFQPVTAVGAAAVSIWAVCYLLFAHRAGLHEFLKARSLLTIAIGLLVAVAAIGVVLSSGLVSAALERYQSAALWNQGSSIRYYYWVMTESFNPFWAVYPLAIVLSLRQHARLGVFAAFVFSLSFVALSFAGMKEDRYALFAMPFFFLSIGIAIATTHRLLVEFIAQSARASSNVSSSLATVGARCMSVGALLFLTISNLGYIQVAKDIADGTVKRDQPRWDLLEAEYGNDLRASAAVVTTTPNYSLYFLKILPVGIGKSRLLDGTSDGQEFSTDFRTGATLISELSSLETLIGCVPHLYLIAEERQWLKNKNTGVNAAMANLIDSRLLRTDLPQSWQLRLYSSRVSEITEQSQQATDCSSVPARLRREPR